VLVDVVFVAGAYLFGSLPVLYWIGLMKGFDLRQEDDMHQALWRKVGFIEGSAGVLWDIFKGPIPPLVAQFLLELDILIVGLSGLAVVAGQMWPVFLRFDSGEKGNTTGLGVTLAISPPTLGILDIHRAVCFAGRERTDCKAPARSQVRPTCKRSISSEESLPL